MSGDSEDKDPALYEWARSVVARLGGGDYEPDEDERARMHELGLHPDNDEADRLLKKAPHSADAVVALLVLARKSLADLKLPPVAAIELLCDGIDALQRANPKDRAAALTDAILLTSGHRRRDIDSVAVGKYIHGRMEATGKSTTVVINEIVGELKDGPKGKLRRSATSLWADWRAWVQYRDQPPPPPPPTDQLMPWHPGYVSPDEDEG